MSIYCFDIDITGVIRKQESYYLGEPEAVSKFIAPWQSVFLPAPQKSGTVYMILSTGL